MATATRSTPISAPLRSGLILAGGLTASAGIVATWLLIWLIFHQTELQRLAFWLEPPVRSPVAPTVLFQKRDALDLGSGGAASNGGLLAKLRDRVAQAGEEPLIVSISAGGFRAPVGANEGEAFLALPSVLTATIPAGTPRPDQAESLAALIEAFRGKPGERRGPRLLILDVGRIGTDRDLGVFGDDLVAWLKTIVPEPSQVGPNDPEWSGCAIFCSCAPGQWSQVSDADGRSVFGFYVGEALWRGRSENRIHTAQQLFAWVSDKVSTWSTAHGRPLQTPIVLGDASLPLVIPYRRLDERRVDQEVTLKRQEMQVASFLKDQLTPALGRQHEFEQRRLGLLAPLAWRDLRESLLRAERFARAGEVEAANLAFQDVLAAERALRPFDVTAPLPGKAMSRAAGVEPIARPEPKPETPPDARSAAPPEAKPETPIRFTETRLGEWAERFGELVKPPADQPRDSKDSKESKEPRTFAQERADKIAAAAQVRAEAETVAAFWQTHPWVEHFLNEGDRHRRTAEDSLFDDELSQTFTSDLAAARKSYQNARLCIEALALSNRVIADLPFLGAWYVERYAETQPRTWDVFEKIVQEGVALDDFLMKAHDRASASAVPTPALLDALRVRTQALTASFERLSVAFRAESDPNSESGGWPTVDRVLRVPGIDPEARLKLLDRAVKLADADRLQPRVEAPAAGANEPSVGKEFLKKGINNEINARSLVQAELSKEAPKGDAARYWDIPLVAQVEPVPDRGYRHVAIGMGWLEWAMLSLGGRAESDGLAHLATTLRSGEVEAVPGLVRRLRARLGETLRNTPITDLAARSAAERAWLSLPSAFDRGTQTQVAAHLANDRRAELLIRQAHRVLDDLDADDATTYLNLVPEAAQRSEAFRAATDRRAALAAGLELRSTTPGTLDLDVDQRPSAELQFQLGGPELPSGTASVLLQGQDPSRVTVSPPGRDREWAVEEVAVGGPTAKPIVMKVSRTDRINPTALTAELLPRVFFRGRLIPARQPVVVRLAPVSREFSFAFRSSNFARHRFGIVSRRKLVDQLEKYGNECYIYSGAATAIDVDVVYVPAVGRPPTRSAVFTATLDGKTHAGVRAGSKPLVAQTRTPIFAGIEIPSGEVNEKEAGSILAVEVRNAEGKLLAPPQQVRLHVVDPSRYYQVTPTVEAVPTLESEAPQKYFKLTIRRLASDPISRDMTVTAEMVYPPIPWGPGMIEHSSARVTSKYLGNIDDYTRPLLHEEWVSYAFPIPPAMEAALGNPTLLKYIVRVGDRQLQLAPPPSLSPPAPAPAPAPAAGGTPPG